MVHFTISIENISTSLCNYRDLDCTSDLVFFSLLGMANLPPPLSINLEVFMQLSRTTFGLSFHLNSSCLLVYSTV